MKTLEIVGDNCAGQWKQVRTACRGVILREGRILLSCETVPGTWMLPGGGLESGEDERDCCVRELAEETGVLIRPGACFLEIDEYYGEEKYVTRYFTGEIVGETERAPTEQERQEGLEPRWLPVEESLGIFAQHERYAGVDEMRRSLYLREYTALRAFLEKEKRLECKPYRDGDYFAVCDFLAALNREDRDHIHWNWARFEWMMEHPDFDRDAVGSIGLWRSGERVVGAAIYDMYFGEAFCAALPGYDWLYPEILDYAWRELKDDAGLGVAICDGNTREIEAAERAGFIRAEQRETGMVRELTGELHAPLPEGLRLAEFDHARDGEALQWLIWQGFDHGEDRAEFERQPPITSRVRPHFDPRLSLAAVREDGEGVAYCCLWYRDDTDYAYVEPVCTVPAWRGRGAAKAILCEAMDRARALGAKRAYVISDQVFYEKLGFEKDRLFSFYWKK